MKTIERRTAVRSLLSHPAKVLHVPSRKYAPAVTCDVSDAGALVRVLGPRHFMPGDPIEVFIQWGRRAVLNDSDRIHATVRRVLQSDRGQLLGVEFAEDAIGKRQAA